MESNIGEFAFFDQKKFESNNKANNGRAFQQCALSVMDTISDPFIEFDKDGISNYYYEYLREEKKSVIKGEEGVSKLKSIVGKIIEEGKGKRYDCILGLSGGVDSTYLCWLAKELGLRPLIVHFDNGWNSELAVKNIENVINILGFDLYTYVVDWEEFKEMQLAYLKSSVVDIEVLTDQAFMAVLYEQARKYKIKYVLAGTNTVTEQVLPKYWIYNKSDTVNIKDIFSKHGRVPLKSIKTYPFLNYNTRRYCEKALNMTVVAPLNYIDYNYDFIKSFISDKLLWKDYGGKHYESVWTRFYQGYILPRKFFIDKRKAHYSTLIFSGQISKENAIEQLKKPLYDKNLLLQDYEFVIKKLGLSPSQFEEIMNLPRKEHSEYKTLKSLKQRYPLLKLISKLLKG